MIKCKAFCIDCWWISEALGIPTIMISSSAALDGVYLVKQLVPVVL